MRRSFAYQPSSTIPFQVISQLGQKIRIIQLAVLLVSAVPVWLVAEAIAPQVVQAYTARADLAIDRLPEENYETILRRAEAVARAAAQRSFDQDILVTDVSVIVSVQNYGAIAPVLALQVSRPQWRNRPDPQRWATYYKTSQALLFLEQNLTNPTKQQPANPTPTPPPLTQPANTTPNKRSIPNPNTTRQPINVPKLIPPPRG